MITFILIMSMTVEEAKTLHHAYIKCLHSHPQKYCNAKYHVKS